MTHGSLFAGIGGFDLGFERAGIRTVWQVEIDPYCRRVLAKHFPHARRYGDIKECCGEYDPSAANCLQFPHHHLPWVDIISGGFPCQDISEAGRRAGIESGERSVLWKEMLRIIGELRPRFAIVENVSALLQREMGTVIGDLVGIGYDAEWDVISACSIGAPHTRERVFIVAYPEGRRRGQCGRIEQQKDGDPQGNLPQWPDKPEPVRMADGISNRLDRLRGLGNAIVPQIAEWIGRRIAASGSGSAPKEGK